MKFSVKVLVKCSWRFHASRISWNFTSLAMCDAVCSMSVCCIFVYHIEYYLAVFTTSIMYWSWTNMINKTSSKQNISYLTAYTLQDSTFIFCFQWLFLYKIMCTTIHKNLAGWGIKLRGSLPTYLWRTTVSGAMWVCTCVMLYLTEIVCLQLVMIKFFFIVYVSHTHL